MRFGLIGCGGIGQLRADALGLIPGSSLVAVSDVDEARAKSVGSQHDAAVVDWRAQVEDDNVDAVIVSTPPSLHADMSIEALRGGKHVLCEKPLARTVEECRAMVSEAQRNGRLLATGFNYRFYPSVLKAREALDAGVIGELDHIRSYTGYSATAHHQAWLHDAHEMGGGALRDNGIHLIDLTRYFLGDPVEVHGERSGAVWGFPGCEDNGFLMLRNESGNVATVQASWTEWRGYRFSIEIFGSLGCVKLTCFPMTTQVVWSTERGGKTSRERSLFPWVHLMEHLRSYRWVVVQSFVKEFEAMSDAIEGKSSAIATGLDGLRTIEIASAASFAQTGRGEQPQHVSAR